MSYTSPIFAELEKQPGIGRFVDSDFRNKEVNPDGFMLATSPDNAPRGTYAPVLEDKAGFTIIDKSEWPDRIEEMDQQGGGLERFIIHIYNQGREGTCTSQQESQKGNVVDCMQFGPDEVVLRSPISIYMQVAPGPGTGSSVGENLVQTRTVGALPLADSATNEEIKHAMSSTGYKRSKYKDGWEEHASMLRSDEYFEIDTSAGFVTALFNGWPVGYGRQGHSILALRPVMRNGTVYVMYVNSWGEWGAVINGRKAYGFDSPSQYGTGATRYGCNCLCSNVVPPWQLERNERIERVTRGSGEVGQFDQDDSQDPMVNVPSLIPGDTPETDVTS